VGVSHLRPPQSFRSCPPSPSAATSTACAAGSCLSAEQRQRYARAEADGVLGVRQVAVVHRDLACAAARERVAQSSALSRSGSSSSPAPRASQAVQSTCRRAGISGQASAAQVGADVVLEDRQGCRRSGRRRPDVRTRRGRARRPARSRRRRPAGIRGRIGRGRRRHRGPRRAGAVSAGRARRRGRAAGRRGRHGRRDAGAWATAATPIEVATPTDDECGADGVAAASAGVPAGEIWCAHASTARAPRMPAVRAG
jgi:hypothetical protein